MRQCINLFVLLILLFPGAMPAETMRWHGDSYIFYRIDTGQEALHLFWKNPQNKPFKTIASLENLLAGESKELVFATNAGIFADGPTPLGLHMENGHVSVPINRKEGHGNFYLQPNGIFSVTAEGVASIAATGDFNLRPDLKLATQSGPLLLQNGQINPLFGIFSTNRKIRSGVGIINAHTVVFVLSENEISFYTLARLFHEQFHCRDALYLDGTISRMFIKNDHQDRGGDFAGILAVTVPK